MSNLSDHVGFSSGGGGGGLPAILTDAPTYIDTASGYLVNSSYINQESTTYQAFHPLATDGTFGGIFDPYDASQNGLVIGAGFYVSPSNGSISNYNYTQMWSHSHGGCFSTCHHGSVGQMVQNQGYHKNPSYGSTNKGFVWGASFSSNATVNATGYGEGPWEGWPHSNGDLAMGADSTTGTSYGRRSTYNQNDSRYYHNNHYFSYGGSVGRQEWTSLSSSTSTNYCWSCAKQSKDDLTAGGMIMYYNSSSQQVCAQIYGSSASRGSESTTYGQKYWSSNAASFHLSNGQYIHFFDKGVLISDSSGNLSEPSTLPEGAGALYNLMANKGEHQRTCIPTKDDDTWIMAANSNVGFLKVHIDVNDNYKVSFTGAWNSLLLTGSSSMSHSGKCIGLVGTNDEYMVYTRVTGAQYQISVFDNPLL